MSRWSLQPPTLQPPNYRHNVAILGSSTRRPEDGTSQAAESAEHLWRIFFEDPTQWLDNRRNKANPTMPDFTHAATGEGLWIESRSKPGWVKSKLSTLQEAKAGPGRAHWAPGRLEHGAAPFEDEASVKRLWQKYFKDPTEWWDIRSSKLHPGSPDFKHKSTNQALTIDNWNTPEWARQALTRETSSTTDGEDGFESGTTSIGDCITAQSPQQKRVSWSALISQHTMSGKGRQALKLYGQMKEDGVKLSSYIFVAALKACASLQDLSTCREIHADVVKSGFESNVFVGTMLVNVYVKCGSLMDARSVFDNMSNRDVVSWTAMILGYAQREQGEEGLRLFVRMQEEGLVPNDRTYVGALKACSSLVAVEQGNEANAIVLRKQCLEQVRAIHSYVVKSGSESDVFVGTMLVDVYAKCGSLADARSVFEKMPHRNVVSWNAMILGYSQMEKGEEALQLYLRMQRECVVPDHRTFIGALKACCSLTALKEGTLGDAQSMKNRCLEQARAIHLDLAKKDFESDVFVGSMLVDVYAKCGSLVEARSVFEKMPHRRNVVSWTAMILGYAQMEEGAIALQLYTQMQEEGVEPNDRTFVAALKACSSLAAFEEGHEGRGVIVKKRCLEAVRAVHTDVVKSGSEADVFVGTMLVDAYAKCGSLVDARHVFEKMPHRNVISWNAMILGYAQMEEGEVALQLYTRMQQEGVLPNDRTFVGALKACSNLAASEVGSKADGKLMKKRSLERVRAMHSDVVNSKFESDGFVGTMLVDVYAKCGSLVDARKVFEDMHHRDVVSWTAMILGYAQMEEGEVALQMYDRMLLEGIVPDDTTYIGVLKACGSVSGLEKGKEVHADIFKRGFHATDSFVASALIDMYGKCGSMVEAQQVFDAFPTQDLVMWNALIVGYARKGESEVVFSLFEKMRQERMSPNAVTFLSVLTVCSHAGLLDKGQTYFEAMKTDYDITPSLDHYTCLVDLLGRAGELDKAMAMVRSMPFQPDGAVWQAVLGACQKWGNLELGTHAFESAVQLDKDDPAAYVLMSNIYAAANMWEEARETQAVRVKTGAWKNPGQSWWTDLEGVVHIFAVGDASHRESEQVYATTTDLLARMQDEGYVTHRPDKPR